MKYTDQTVYCCDLCGSTIISQDNIDFLDYTTAYFNLEEEHEFTVPDEQFFFTEMNCFPTLRLNITPIIVDHDLGVVDCYRSVENEYVHLCGECSEKYGAEYKHLVHQLEEWWRKANATT